MQDEQRFVTKRPVSRRLALAALGIAALAGGAPLLVGARETQLDQRFSGSAADRSLGLNPRMPCTPGTLAQTEGPYYSPGSPRRTVLREKDSTGEPLEVEGLVLTPDCRPVAGAVVDIWHCDQHGAYDNSGFRHRGHQYTDPRGAYRFLTIRPGPYRNRTPHIHVKVQGEFTRLLTTQMYFSDRSGSNDRDGIFREELLMDLKLHGEVWRARFDFVLASL